MGKLLIGAYVMTILGVAVWLIANEYSCHKEQEELERKELELDELEKNKDDSGMV